MMGVRVLWLFELWYKRGYGAKVDGVVRVWSVFVIARVRNQTRVQVSVSV